MNANTKFALDFEQRQEANQIVGEVYDESIAVEDVVCELVYQRAMAERLTTALRDVVIACRNGKRLSKGGYGGQTADASLSAMYYTRVEVGPVDHAEELLCEIGKLYGVDDEQN